MDPEGLNNDYAKSRQLLAERQAEAERHNQCALCALLPNLLQLRARHGALRGGEGGQTWTTSPPPTRRLLIASLRPRHTESVCLPLFGLALQA